MRFIGLFSGGRDSLTACHYAARTLGMKEVLYCHTGVGLNEPYVKKICKKLGWKLNIVYPRREKEYEYFCNRYGFPRPTSHSWIMHRLKLNPIRKFYNTEKKKGEIILISGIRINESKRRKKNFKDDRFYNKSDGMRFIKPIAEWSKQKTLDYIKKHDLEISPIYQTMGISGDCFCGAYSKKTEGLKLMKHHPKLANYLKELETRGYRGSWGQYMSLTACQGQKTLDGLVCNECITKEV